MSFQDWTEVTIGKGSRPKTQHDKKVQLAQAQRQGNAVSVKKYAAGGNKQQPMQADARKLDDDMESLAHKKVAPTVRKAIQQGRQALGLTQKELAMRINQKPTVVNEYESGKAIPSNSVLAAMERVLKVKLRGKDIGQPIAPKVKKAAGAGAKKKKKGN